MWNLCGMYVGCMWNVSINILLTRKQLYTHLNLTKVCIYVYKNKRKVVAICLTTYVTYIED